jgi:hypothetical protein
MMRALPVGCFTMMTSCPGWLPHTHFSIDNANCVPQYLNVYGFADKNAEAGIEMGPRIENSKEELDGDKEKGCQEKKEKVSALRS